MLLKVGQLAKQVCLSVRTLHHYDEIGLLSPSVRTEAGHRLYNSLDIQRLYAIQALKEFGLSLPQIAERITQESPSLTDILNQQLAQIEHQIEQAQQLKKRLKKLHQFSASHIESSPSDWLTTLALTNIYARHFTTEELDALSNYAQEAKDELEQEWPLMVKQLQLFVDENYPPTGERAKNFVIKWTAMFEQFVGHNPALLLKVHALSQQELYVQFHRGISPKMIEFLGEAMSAVHQDIYAKYLTPEQQARLNQNKIKNRDKWPPLIAAVRAQLDSGAGPLSESVRPLAAEWKKLFETSVTGGDVVIHAQLKLAYAQEPLLMQGTGLDTELLGFIRAAMDSLE